LKRWFRITMAGG